LKVIVDKSDGIKLLNTDTKKAKKEIELGVGVKSKVVSKNKTNFVGTSKLDIPTLKSLITNCF
jgi:hypothetical protein